MENIKEFITGILVRWILKIAGTYLTTIGIQEGTITEIIGGILAILMGIGISVFQHNKAINTTPAK